MRSKINLHSLATFAAYAFAVYLIVAYWHSPARYRVRVKVGGRVVSEFWTTNKSEVESWASRPKLGEYYEEESKRLLGVK